MIDRRSFISNTAFGLAALDHGIIPAATATPQMRAGSGSPVLMKLGCQSGPLNDEHLQFFKRHSVTNICATLPSPKIGRINAVDDLSQLRELCEKHGIGLDMIAPPFLGSTHVDRTARPAIMLGQSPERDRDIEDIQTLIRNCAKVGIPAIKYNLNLLGVIRTNPTPGRGGSIYSTWRLEEAGDLAKRMTRAGRVTADLFWERISYFLDRVIPAAEEYKIRMACHPHDPGVPPGFEGVDCVLGSVEGLKRLISIKESPYHGLNFCQGTVGEMLQDPGREILDIIRYFGARKKIFNVHFRNIRGRRDSFQETFPDEGDVDMLRALVAYREVGYPYMLMPDHVPHHAGDPDGLQAFAFCYGYIRGLLQTVQTLA
jgi:mannonate dehydratase